MINYVKEPHTAIFPGPSSCGKAQRLLDLIEKEYRHQGRIQNFFQGVLKMNKKVFVT